LSKMEADEIEQEKETMSYMTKEVSEKEGK
jgi:hypothetical protein